MTDLTAQQDSIDALIRRIFSIQDVTLGTAQQPYLYRFRGHLLTEDSATAYEQLSEALKSFHLTPLFRIENGQHVILLIRELPPAKGGKPAVNLLMFLLTLLSVLFAGGYFNQSEPLPSEPLQAMLALVKTGWPFAVSILAILGVHEFGHYFAGRAHGVKVSLPFFIPMPFSPLGTMGAFINMKEIPRNKRVLMDIGVAGPIAGYLVSLVVIWIGLSFSHIDTIPLTFPEGQGLQIEGNSITYLFLKWLYFGQWLPQPADYGSLSPILYWIKYFFTGRPFPLGGTDVMIHSVAWAGWAGLLVTSLNLIPVGQLDGGHIFHLLFGTKGSRKIYPFLLALLAGLGFLWSGWWLWTMLLLVFGRVYAEPLDQITPLDKKRKVLGILALVIFLLTFIPVPLSVML